MYEKNTVNIWGTDEHLLELLNDLLSDVSGTPNTRINHPKQFVVLTEVVDILKKRKGPNKPSLSCSPDEQKYLDAIEKHANYQGPLSQIELALIHANQAGIAYGKVQS